MSVITAGDITAWGTHKVCGHFQSKTRSNARMIAAFREEYADVKPTR
jgi:hypothetical protein